jgi:23S rRNA (uracil1939-C5)-methyltransferase
MRRKKKLPLFEKVKIDRIAAEGKCVARVDNQVIFVENVAPGDVVDIRITKDKKSFLEGSPIKFHEYSDVRKDPFCQYFGTCGGCKWQSIDYEVQLQYKRQQVIDNLERIAKVQLPEIDPIVPSGKTSYYRNKLEFTFSNRRWLSSDDIASGLEFNKDGLGFHIPKRFDKVVDIDHCYLQQDPSNRIRTSLRDYAIDNKLEFFDLIKMTGLMRNLIIRTANTGELMVIVQFGRYEKEAIEGVMNFLQNEFPEITSLFYIVNTKGNETFHDLEVHLWHGKNFIIEEMEGLKFKVGPKSFYQTNSEQSYELYKIARDFAGLEGDEIVYDLYTGTGTIANFVAKNAKKVIGLEYVPEAIEDAKVNSEVNNITNTTFYSGDIKDLLDEEFIMKHGRPDVVITDPPRAGMHEDVIRMLIKASPKKIVYVSCNPATQARDLALLDERYSVEKVRPVDMFPHTYHVENVVLLKLKHL